MTYKTYKTRSEADKVAREMQGWDARAVAGTDYEGRRVWLVQVRTGGDPMYLRTDGYVR